MKFAEHRARSGLRVLVEENPYAFSAAAGFFVRTGARDEEPRLAGVSHFLEHMAFKSTRKRNALEVSLALDRMGSRANAYTSWEKTTYYGQVLPEHARTLIELIAEMIQPALLLEDFEVEKKVILEEIEMYNDRPDFLLFEGLVASFYRDHPLGIKILGTPETIGRLTHAEMRDYHSRRYRAENIVLAVAGAVRAEEVFGWADALEIAPGGGGDRLAAPPSEPVRWCGVRPQDVREQFLIAWPGPLNGELRPRVIAQIASYILGDDDGSRLFWALVHPGIADDADAGTITFADHGLFYAGFSSLPDRYSRAASIMDLEMKKVRDGIGEAEFRRAQTKFATRTIMASESPMGRMSNLGSDRLDGLPYMDLDEELRLILSIRRDEVEEFFRGLGEPCAIGATGPMTEEDALNTGGK